MPTPLPPNPSLEWLRKSAKRRLVALRRSCPEARLAEAQRDVARSHGFASWRRLKVDVERRVAERRAAEETGAARLLRSVAIGRLEEVQALLDATPELVDATGPHPFWGGRPQALHVAIEAGRRDVVDLLIERGAGVDGNNGGYDEWSPLMLATRRPGMVEELLVCRGLPAKVPNGGSLLAFARTLRAIDLLLAHGAAIGARDRWGTTPVEALSRLGPAGAPLVAHLVARGAVASPAEHARLGDLAALAGAAARRPAAVTADEVLTAAVETGRHEVVEWLLARGADPDARAAPPSRRTALHAAAWGGDLRMVELLLAAGADLHARDEEHDATPRGWAETSIEVTRNPDCAEVVAYLEARGG